MRIPFEEITHTIQRAHWPYLRHVYVTPAVYLKKKLSDKYQAGNHTRYAASKTQSRQGILE